MLHLPMTDVHADRSLRARPLAMVVPKFPRFTQTFIVNKFVGLLDRGWNVHIVSPTDDAETPWELFPQLPPRSELVDRVHVAEDIEAVLLQLEPQLVHFEFAELAVRRTYLKHILECPVVVGFRSPIHYSLQLGDRDPSRLGPQQRNVIESLWANSDALHLLSHDLWRTVQAFGCPADKLHAIIPPAIDTDYFNPGLRQHHDCGAAQRPLRILSVGRLHKNKGYPDGLDAVRLLRAGGIACEYRIVGDGAERPAIEALVHELGLEDVVTLMGVRGRDEVRDAMRWADVLLHPAIMEPFGNAVLEAQAMSLPVVCTDVDGLPENVDNGVTGFIVAACNPRAQAERLAELSRSAALRERLGAAGRRRLVTGFRLEDQITAFEALYATVLGGAAVLESAGAAGAAPEIAIRESRQQRRTRLLSACRTFRQLLGGEEERRDSIVAEIREIVMATLPPRATVLVVSDGEDRLLHLGRRTGWHFPQTEHGEYAGYYPGDTASVIAHLNELQAIGAEFVLFPHAAFWWLDHYEGLREHLEHHGPPMVERGECLVFALGPSGRDA